MHNWILVGGKFSRERAKNQRIAARYATQFLSGIKNQYMAGFFKVVGRIGLLSP